jgi:hypothetical protein
MNRFPTTFVYANTPSLHSTYLRNLVYSCHVHTLLAGRELIRLDRITHNWYMNWMLGVQILAVALRLFTLITFAFRRLL